MSWFSHKKPEQLKSEIRRDKIRANKLESQIKKEVRKRGIKRGQFLNPFKSENRSLVRKNEMLGNLKAGIIYKQGQLKRVR